MGIKWLKTKSETSGAESGEVREAVAEIIADVRCRGMAAVREYAGKFDGFPGPFRVPPEAARDALAGISPDLKEALSAGIENVRKFHSLQRSRLEGGEWEISPGSRAGFRYVPVGRVGVYIPGGRYPLPSSAIMSVVPAQEAGVGSIAAFSPPGRNGGVDGTVLAVLSMLGVDEIWALGGAHAIAAMSAGAADDAETIEKVDFIAGPGNAYVAEAKRTVYGDVGIDGVAGPSEVLIIADEGANPLYCANDLLAQSEHDPMAGAVLLAADESFAARVLGEVERLLPGLPTREVAGAAWRTNGAVGAVKNIDEAIEYANKAAPEHLQLAISDPKSALAKCRAYGAAFLGYSSSEVFGDYIAGTNHTLPTGGRAAFSSGLWTGSFMRALTHLDLTEEAASRLAKHGSAFAEAEGLEGHRRALLSRMRKR